MPTGRAFGRQSDHGTYSGLAVTRWELVEEACQCRRGLEGVHLLPQHLLSLCFLDEGGEKPSCVQAHSHRGSQPRLSAKLSCFGASQYGLLKPLLSVPNKSFLLEVDSTEYPVPVIRKLLRH